MVKFFLWQTAFLFLLDLCLTSIFGSYIFRKYQLGQWRSASSNAGTALLVYFFGMAWVRGSLLLWRHAIIDAGSETNVDIFLFSIGTVLAVLGAMCILRLFAEFSWQWMLQAYIWCIVVASILAAVVTIY